MIEKMLNEIIKNQSEPKFDTCRESGRLNVAACLAESGIKPQDGWYTVEFYPFPSANYSLLDFTDFDFIGCIGLEVNFTGCHFSRCQFDASPLDLSGAYLIDLTIDSFFGSPKKYIGSHLTNCRLASTIKNLDFTDALIDSTGDHNYGLFFYGDEDSVTLESCVLNGVTIRHQLLDGRFLDCEMKGAIVEDCAFHQVSLPETVSHTHFNNVTALAPTNPRQLRFYRVNRGALVFSTFHDNAITNCDWNGLALLGSASTVEVFHHDFLGNEFVNNSLHCSFLAINWQHPNRNRYGAETLGDLLNSTRHGARVENNNVSRINGSAVYPCTVNATSLKPAPMPGWKIGVIVGGGVAALAALVGGLFLLKRFVYNPLMAKHRQKIVYSRLGRLIWPDEWPLQFVPRSKENTLRYQAVLLRLVHLVTSAMALKANRAALPNELIVLLLDYFPTVNVQNSTLLFRQELIDQRSALLWSVRQERVLVSLDDDVRIDVAPRRVGHTLFNRRRVGERAIDEHAPLLGCQSANRL